MGNSKFRLADNKDVVKLNFVFNGKRFGDVITRLPETSPTREGGRGIAAVWISNPAHKAAFDCAIGSLLDGAKIAEVSK